MSGAPSSNKRLRRLFLLIILRYKSFKSEVAKRPPSSCTIGRRSGGMTGTTSIIIHSGLFPEPRKASTTSRRLIILAFFCPVASFKLAFNSLASASKSIAWSSSFMDSAPIPTRKPFFQVSLASAYSFSERICLYSKSVSPLSRTI